MQWLRQCHCAEKPPSWYPARLVDIRKLKRGFLDPETLHSTGQLDESKIDEIFVRVVSTSSWTDGKPGHKNIRYVTLSHRWGAVEHHGIKLTEKSMHDLERGIRVGSLPRTFRDAIRFAARLPQVGYIWIDSLCIKQATEEDTDISDWLAQSAVMNEVYGNGYLNISATAARDSEGGLFFARSPEQLFEDDVKLNVDGIPVAWYQDAYRLVPVKKPTLKPDQSSQWSGLSFLRIFLQVMKSWLEALFSLLQPSSTDAETEPLLPTANRHGGNSIHNDNSSHPPDEDPRNLHQCTVLDASFWDDHVDGAPVNKRAWVLQERLLCPRVVHFCYDQVAWECAEFDAAEARPRGVPNFQLNREGIVDQSRFKGLDPRKHGRDLRISRLKGLPDPVPHLQPQIYAFELWKRIVEVYTRTSLTKEQDKMIALSGIARIMATKIGSKKQPAQYVAGLWRPYLESQLLWKVESVFHHRDGTFEHPGRRPRDYRVPSFSWAAVDTDAGNGITYGEVTDRDVYITIEDVRIQTTSDDSFGLVTSGSLSLYGKLRKCVLSNKGKGRYYWKLRDRGELDDEEHRNVYLDSVANTPFETDNTYCLPAAKGGYLGTGDSTYIFCLLLHLVDKEEAIFERIGCTKLSTWADKKTYSQILDTEDRDIDMPHIGYLDGRHKLILR
jgi:hypothetical protein